MEISHIKAREILDSRGNPTLEVDLITTDGTLSRAAVPSGASTGKHEARELRDDDTNRYGGKGVLKAVANVNEVIAPALMGKSVDQQLELDLLLQNIDGTEDKSHLGANALLGVSLACLHAGAAAATQPLYRYIQDLAGSKTTNLPLPLVNIFNGGAHAVNSSTIQEFMITPIGATTLPEAIRWCSEVFQQLKHTLEANGHTTAVGDEGGFAPGITSDEAVLALIAQAITDAGYKLGQDISLALDVAASEFYQTDGYHLGDSIFDRDQMIEWLDQLRKDYPIVSIEDGLDEDDWDGWVELTKLMGSDTQLVGDDLLVTNTDRLKSAIDKQAANAILIKPNQIGTISETLEAIKTAQAAGWNCIISHRSGETADTTIAHLAVGTGASQIKTGSMSRSERVEKYNELLRISDDLGQESMQKVFTSTQ